jgi:TonB family protein
MLNELLESRSNNKANKLGTATSTAVHIGVILSALYVTNTRPLPAVVPERETHILISPKSTATAPRNTRSSPASVPATRRALPASLSLDLPVATDIPVIEFRPGTDVSSDFRERSSPSWGLAPSGEAREPADGAPFDALEVDTPASAMGGGPVPEYPARLRAARVEGEVVAQFVVDAQGNAIPNSIRIVSATNDLFSESVRATIPRMKFSPGRLRGKPVQQTVQQLFVFRLSR